MNPLVVRKTERLSVTNYVKWCLVLVVLVNAAYLTSTDNIHYAELMSVVETLSRDTDRDVQYIISKQHDS